MERDRDLIDQLIADWREQRPDLECESMGVVGRIVHLGTLLRASASAALEPCGLSYTDLDILATLRRKGEPFRLTPTELSNAVLLTSGAMTTAVKRLADRGLVARGEDPSDGRIKTVALTPAGKTLVDEAIGHRFAEADTAISQLKREEAAMLETLLRRLVLSSKRGSHAD